MVVDDRMMKDLGVITVQALPGWREVLSAPAGVSPPGRASIVPGVAESWF